MSLRAFLCSFLLLLPSWAGASTALLKSQPATVITFAGKGEIKITPMVPSSATTVVLLMDQITPEQLIGFKKDLLAAYLPARGAKLRLGMLQSDRIVFAGPFPTRLRLKAALDEIHAAPTPASQPSGSAVVELLFSNVAQFGHDWSSVVFVGDVPALEKTSADYAIALLLREFTTQQVRVSWVAATVASSFEAWFPLLHATGGNLFSLSAHNLSSMFDSPGTLFQADWSTEPPAAGFVCSHTVLSDAAGAVLLDVPEIVAQPQMMLPTMALYEQMRSRAGEAGSLAQPVTITPEAGQQIRDALKFSLGINPRDPEALQTASNFYEKFQDFESAIRFRGYLVEIQPNDSGAHAAYGHVLYLGKDLTKAEPELERAASLGPRTPRVLEDLAMIHQARKDDAGSLPYLKELLDADAQRQDTWFLQGQAASRIPDTSLAIRSFEKGIALGGFHLAEVRSLLSLYIKADQPLRAKDLASATLASLPPDVETRSRFASALEDLHFNEQALTAWRSVLQVNPEFAQAHERIAALLFGAGDFGGASTAADSGLGIAPQTLGLYIVKADAAEKLGHYYEGRRVLQRGADTAASARLLQRLAVEEETYGGGAAAYQRLLEVPELGEADRTAAAQKGLSIAMRDGNTKLSRTLAGRLKSSGHPEAIELLGNEQSAGDAAMVFGGLPALAFAARAREQASPERFFAEFARAVIDHTGPLNDPKEIKSYAESVDQYLHKLSSLETMGSKHDDHVEISLSLKDKQTKSRTETVIALLGLKLRSGKNGPELDFGESKTQAKNQEALAALAIDQVGIQEAFQAGKPFTLEIPYERALIYPSEKMWKDAFFVHENPAGGFAGVLLHSMKVAQLYAGMSYLDRETIQQLVSAVDLRALGERYAEIFYNFAPALAVHAGHAVCPGGIKAEGIWAQMAGATPSQPGSFFRALLDRDDGKLLAYFYTLSNLDPSRQAFFTANAQRTDHFYRLFVTFKERQLGTWTTMRDNSFLDFLRSIPMDASGHVAFPGSPAVWMVAKGNAAAETKMSSLAKASSRWVGTEIEDEVLIRLAQARYRDKAVKHTELDNFLAVARIDAHRSVPLDDESALLLAQHFSEASESYAYFTDLTSLKLNDFQRFFSILQSLRAQSAVDASLRLGEFHSLIEWICILKQRQAISDADAARLFSVVMQKFSAGPVTGLGGPALESAQEILKACKGNENSASPDSQVRACLTGGLHRREQEFSRVLELQKVPSMEALFAIYRISSAGGTEADIPLMNRFAAAMPSAEVGPKVKFMGSEGNTEKEQIAHFNPAGLQKAVAHVAEKKASGKLQARDWEKLRREVMAELEPQVALALSGVVYAYFLRPTDLVIAEDPVLLRKHRFFDFALIAHDNPINVRSEFAADSEGAGSYFRGGFASFALAAGTAAGATLKTGGQGGSQTIVAQIAAIRATPWDLLTESDFRLVGLRINIAREWIIASATQPGTEQALDEATVGMLSLARRADLLNGIRSRNWNKVWESITLPDLFSLGGRYLDRFTNDPWPSATATLLREISLRNDGARLLWLGAVPYHSSGCSHPHLLPLPPYEEYEHRFFPVDNAERWAEFKIYLAYQMDQAGGDPSALSGVAETLAAKAFRAAQLTDFRDWRSLLSGYASITPADLKRAWQQ